MKSFILLLSLGGASVLFSCCASAPESVTQGEVVCCGGNCNAPAGTCCADGTCRGNHAELPIWNGK